jgi:hypothetical protein
MHVIGCRAVRGTSGRVCSLAGACRAPPHTADAPRPPARRPPQQFEAQGLACVNPGAPNSTRYWSSARIHTRNKIAFMYQPGKALRIAARVRIPQGERRQHFAALRLVSLASLILMLNVVVLVSLSSELGTWPAFWLLPDTNRTDCLGCGAYGNGWCSSGEVRRCTCRVSRVVCRASHTHAVAAETATGWGLRPQVAAARAAC